MEANYAYYCLHQFHMLPSAFLNLPRKEKATIAAFVDLKLEHEKQKIDEMKAKQGGF